MDPFWTLDVQSDGVTFWLAEQFNKPVLGLDLNFAMLMHAHDAMRNNRVGYGLTTQRCGL